MRREKDVPRLIHWALFDKDPELSRAALRVLREEVYAVVEYLYETAMWAESHSIGRRKRLPSRGVRILDETVRILVRMGRTSVDPLVNSIITYDSWGRTDENAKVLYFLLVFDALEKIGKPAVSGLHELAADKREEVYKPARETIKKLDRRGILDR